MGIFPPIVELFENEAPLTGDVVTIGRQMVHNCTDLNGQSVTDDLTLFRMLGATSVRATDISSYEGAEIIHDLNLPLPQELHGIADFIYDGSCLDNIFNVSNALVCFSKMLRPNGKMILLEHSTSIQGAMLAFAPEWFFNFFAINNYQRCSIHLFKFINVFGPWLGRRWYCFDDKDQYMPTSVRDVIPDIGDFLTAVVVQKGNDSTDDIAPVQADYRVRHASPEHDKYVMAHRRFKAAEQFA